MKKVKDRELKNRREVLVALLTTSEALKRARIDHWYHVPTVAVMKWIKNRWPPQHLAFYQGKVHLHEAYSIRYYAEVLHVATLLRVQLFPNEPNHPNANASYCQVHLGPLQELPRPIYSRRFRRIVFISTSWQKFHTAVEINDLFDESPLEDSLWAEFKRIGILAERQLFIKIDRHNYALDFAIPCQKQTIDVETDGDTWHSDPQYILKDIRRDNDLETAGYKLLRFNTQMVRTQLVEYCIPTILKNIEITGGQNEGSLIS